MIDLCWRCVLAIHQAQGYAKVIEHPIDGRILYVNHGLAVQLSNGTRHVAMPNGETLPMVAITTLNNSRVCGIHATEKP